VLAIEAPRRISYSWRGEEHHRPTVVTWTLEPKDGGTLLRLEHSGFRGVGGTILKLMLGSGWAKMLKTSLPEVLALIDASGYRAPPGGTAHGRKVAPTRAA
jgi:uncharacterized protein YndB with AHSA1/START domain